MSDSPSMSARNTLLVWLILVVSAGALQVSAWSSPWYLSFTGYAVVTVSFVVAAVVLLIRLVDLTLAASE